MLMITHSDLDHQGGAHALKSASPGLWISCGALDIPLVSDPEVLVSRRYQGYRAEHGLTPSDDALRWIERVKPRRAILTNMHSDLDFNALKAMLPSHVEPAYDGLRFEAA